MKTLIALTILICLVGCQSAPDKPVADKYTVQVMEVVVPRDQAAAAWPDMVWAADPSALQLADIHQYIRFKDVNSGVFSAAPEGAVSLVGQYTDARVISTAADRILRIPGTKIIEFPLVQLSVGERVINDQTETIELPSDYDVVDDKATVSMMEPFRSGLSIDIELIEVNTSTSTYLLKLHSGQVAGFDIFTLPTGDEIKMPQRFTISRSTEIIQPLNSWNMIGGLVTEKTEGDETSGKSQVIYIRILPPSATVESSANGTVSNDWNFVE